MLTVQHVPSVRAGRVTMIRVCFCAPGAIAQAVLLARPEARECFFHPLAAQRLLLSLWLLLTNSLSVLVILTYD